MSEQDLLFLLKKGLTLTNVQLGELLYSLFNRKGEAFTIKQGSGIKISFSPDTSEYTISIDPESEFIKKIEALETSLGNLTSKVTALESKRIAWEDVENKPSFSTVATSGEYTDLSNTPDLSGFATTAALNSKANTAQTIKKITLTGAVTGSVDVPDAPANGKEVSITTASSAS